MAPFLRKMLASDRVGGRTITLINTMVVAVVFIFDSAVPEGVSINSFYSLVIIIAAFAPNPRACFWWAAVATVASSISSIVAPAGFGILWEAVDRGSTIVSLWALAVVVYSLRQARDEAARENVRALDALATKGRFLSAASHDLRQPVQSLVLFAAVLKNKLKDHPAQGIAASIVTAVEALKTLLDDVLETSKLEAGVVRPQISAFAIGELLLRLADEYTPRATAKGLTLRAVPTCLWTKSDKALIERILRNLMDNAIRYSASGGVLIGCRRRGSHIRLDVIDTGRGIPSDQVAHIFEEFYQLENPQRSRERGHGLGLAIVKQIADLLGHPLEVAPNGGRGTRFSLRLPNVPAEAPQESAPIPAAAPQPVDMPVLLIEDDPLVLPALRAALEELHCRVTAAISGATAMAAARAHPPALIISDFRLPGGRDGIEIISDIRSLLGVNVPALLLTGDPDPAIEERSRQVAIGLLRKPVSQSDLASLVGIARTTDCWWKTERL